MAVSRTHDMGKYIKDISVLGSSQVLTYSSDGAPNAVEVVGRVIDRLAYGRRYYSMKVVIPFTADCTGGNVATGSFAIRLQHATSTAAVDFANLGSTGVVRTFGATATATEISGTVSYDADLRVARRYLRVMLTPNMSASSSGMLRYHAVGILGGADEVLNSTSDPIVAITT